MYHLVISGRYVSKVHNELVWVTLVPENALLLNKREASGLKKYLSSKGYRVVIVKA